jgi:hypothetical protein
MIGWDELSELSCLPFNITWQYMNQKGQVSGTGANYVLLTLGI